MGAMASKITSLTIIYSSIYSSADQREHQSSASLAFVRGIYRRPVNSPHKWPVTRKMFPFDDVIMVYASDTPEGQHYIYDEWTNDESTEWTIMIMSDKLLSILTCFMYLMWRWSKQ